MPKDFNEIEQLCDKNGWGKMVKWLDDTHDAGCPPFDGRTIEWPQKSRWVLPKEDGMKNVFTDIPSEDGFGGLGWEERAKEALRSFEESRRWC
jgi:hypothetical protein